MSLATSPGGGWTKTKLMLNSTKVEDEVEVGVELGNKWISHKIL